MKHFDETSTTEQVMEGVSLEGKLAVVTGASSGLGVETCRVLAAAGATVMMVARSDEKLQAAVKEIQQEQPGAQLDTQSMDLADLDSVRSASTDILLHHAQIHLLINNAGLFHSKHEDFSSLNPDIWIEEFRVNSIAPFLVTRALKSNLANANSSVVGIISSKMGSMGDNQSGRFIH